MGWGLWLGLVLSSTVQGPVPQSHLVVVSGIGGDPQYRERFYEWGVTLVDAAKSRLGIPRSHVTFLAEIPDRDPERITARSTKEHVVETLVALADRAGSGDLVFIVLIGHGSAEGETARFNVPGPDMTAEDFAELLDRFAAQRIVFVNTATASGGFLPVLSGPNRTVITATKTGFERNEAIFGGFFVKAFADAGADRDKDERVSVLEAFQYARREVERAYESDQRLLTEHALLDDNGDGEGSSEPDPQGGDGALARRVFLSGAGGPGRAAGPVGDEASDPRLAELLRDKQQIEADLESLRTRKDDMQIEDYEDALEELLVELALTDREIRQRRERNP